MVCLRQRRGMFCQNLLVRSPLWPGICRATAILLGNFGKFWLHPGFGAWNSWGLSSNSFDFGFWILDLRFGIRRRLKPRLHEPSLPPQTKKHHVIFMAGSSTRGGGFCFYRRGFNRRVFCELGKEGLKSSLRT